ncbi:universal stress protein [Maribacter polysiphoniae]|uniref:Nucleotide-binding universal stress UspA family protein n=1 Tax=Maribacter polysiphoniae TaxID=429344 RepID=A0A316E024_9FLAO|nr:universal stress protein [Maribacter polysiphoniae]MBD1261048.1 universal stress protein [Maribacter polysiphoniae]PWK23711.1 nucleotide-binding universal stress UspA family protein [Maribacter polysiphoniae]
MQNILIPTDFSNDAYNALFYASKLFKSKTCNFYLLNAYNENTPLVSRNTNALDVKGHRKGLLEQLNDESCEELKRTFHRINLDHKCPNHTYKLIPMKRDLTEAVSKTIDEYHIDLVIMGNKGGSNGLGVFLGSSTTKVLASVKNCPILAVPMNADFQVPYEIAFATDYKRHYNAKVLEPLKSMATHCGSAVRILHINEEERLSKVQESNLKTLRAYLETTPNTVHWMPSFTSKTKAIQVFLDELGIGMLTMVNYEHGFLENLLKEPIIKKLTFNIDIPFLVIPGKS